MSKLKLLLEPTDFTKVYPRTFVAFLFGLTCLYLFAVILIGSVFQHGSFIQAILDLDIFRRRVESLQVLSPATLPYYAATLVLTPIYCIACLIAMLATHPLKYWHPKTDLSGRVKPVVWMFLIACLSLLPTFAFSLFGASGEPLRYSAALKWPIFLFLSTTTAVFFAFASFQLIGAIWAWVSIRNNG